MSSHTLKKLLFVCHSCSTSRLYVGYYYKMAFQSYLAMIHLYLCCAQIICTSVTKPFAFANYVLQFAKTLYAKKQVFSFILDIYTYISRVYIDHLLFHCTKTRVLWDLLFTLFGVSWVLPSSVRETLLSWHGSFVGKKCKKVRRAAPLYIFWTVWKARNRLAFNDDVLSIQRLKYLFVFSLWSEAKLFIADCPLTLVSFIDWLSSS